MPIGQRVKPKLVPAASRAATRLSAAELDLSGDAIETFTTAVGGREKLLTALAIADSEHHADQVVNCLLDPKYRKWSLRRICAHAGITIADLFASYKRALFVRAHVEAAHHITSKLTAIVEDVMARALPMPTSCPRCHGRPPDLPELPPCWECNGTGQILNQPDLAHQKLALELGRLIERKGGGVTVQQTAIAAGAVALQSTNPGNLEQLQQVVGELLFSPGRRRALAPPATVVDVPPAAPEAGA